MRERPILFSAPMVRALLLGTKTQTRRLVTPQPPSVEAVRAKSGIDFSIFNDGRMHDRHGRPLWRVAGPVWAVRDLLGGKEPDGVHWNCPYGVAGDRLWVRETHAQFSVGNRTGYAPQCVAYRATCDEDGCFDYVNNGDEIMQLKITKWTPAIHMPRWTSRITLEVTRVRVDRLQDITEGDARAEGTEFGEMQPAIVNGEPGRVAFFNARDAFAHLWEAINGKRAGWKSNPWVWVVEFRRIEQPPQFGPPVLEREVAP